MKETVVFERGDLLYIVGPVTPVEPEQSELDELAFADDLRKIAPSEHIGWMRGQYVEADRPNLNGAEWTAKELAIKSLTPMLMPVTVMHDPRTAVGLIADTKLLTPDADNVPRSRIDTTLGIWRHRFPDVWDEVGENYQAGSLMQSMECRKSYYDCGVCGMRFVPLPDDAEQVNWCAHLRGETAAENGVPVRRLGGISFTGTGLIFGTRGAKGAMPDASLEVLQEEVAEFHERAHRHEPRRPRRTSKKMEVDDKVYEELIAAKSERDSLKARLPELEEKAGKLPEVEKTVEKLETEKVSLTKERDDLKSEKEKLEETARKDTLGSERQGKLGKDFLAKLGEITRGRLDEQAKTMTEDEWAKRLEELEEIAEVKHDAGGPPAVDAGVVTTEETARARLGGREAHTTEPSPVERHSVIAGLNATLVKS